MKSFLKAASLIALLATSGGAAVAQSSAIDGRWDAVISHNGSTFLSVSTFRGRPELERHLL